MPKSYVIMYTTKGKKVNAMLEMTLMMMAFLYSAFFSMNWMWLFPIAVVIFSVKEYLKKEEKKNKKRG